jgi:hypothetical protein
VPPPTAVSKILDSSREDQMQRVRLLSPAAVPASFPAASGPAAVLILEFYVEFAEYS